MTTRSAQQALAPGRMILTTNKISKLQQLGVILDKAPAQNKLLAKSISPGLPSTTCPIV